MFQKVYCTVASPEQAGDVLARMQRVGFSPDETIVASGASEVETLVHSESDYAYSTKLGVGLGFLAGAVVGLAQLVYIDSAALNEWAGVASIPLSNALGFALYGWIIGGSGVLARGRMPAKLERHLEEEVAQTKIVLSVSLHNSE
jgi:hypothetical protein